MKHIFVLMFVLIAIATSLMLSLTLVTMESRGIVLLDKHGIIDEKGFLAYSFYLCRDSEKTTRNDIDFLVVLESNSSVKLKVLDYEQYIEEEGRGDLYGYLALLDGIIEKASIRIRYPRAMPCWPIYVKIEGSPGTYIHIRIELLK